MCALLSLLFASHQQNRRLNIFCFKCDWEDERVNVTECDFSGGVCVHKQNRGRGRSVVQHRLTFSQLFVLELMFVHRRDRCCVYVKEMQSYRAKLRLKFAIPFSWEKRSEACLERQMC